MTIVGADRENITIRRARAESFKTGKSGKRLFASRSGKWAPIGNKAFVPEFGLKLSLSDIAVRPKKRFGSLSEVAGRKHGGLAEAMARIENLRSRDAIFSSNRSGNIIDTELFNKITIGDGDVVVLGREPLGKCRKFECTFASIAV